MENTENEEKTNKYQYIMRHIDIYGEPLNWFIGNHETYNTTVGGCRTFIVIGCALVFLIYSIYNLFHDRNGSFIFYDITYPEIEDAQFYYYQDFEIFFFFQSSGREWMTMDTDIFQVSLIQTTASDDEEEEEDDDSSSSLRNLKMRKKIKNDRHIFYKNKNNQTVLKKLKHDNHIKNKSSYKNIITILRNLQGNSNGDGNTNQDSNTNSGEGTSSSDSNIGDTSGTSSSDSSNIGDNTNSGDSNMGSDSSGSSSDIGNAGEDSSGTGSSNTDTNNDNTGSSGDNSGNTGGDTGSSGGDNGNNGDDSGSNTGDGGSGGDGNTGSSSEGSGSSSDDENEILAYYNFTQCDNDYFTEQLGFSANIEAGLSTTYCFDSKLYKNTTINYTLSPINPLGENTNPMTFEFIQVCASETCTNQENQKFKKVISSIRNLKVFIKSYIPNPLSINEPIQSQVLTFTLTKSHKGTTIYFKNVEITTDSSLIPYVVGPSKKEFLQFDYSEDDYEESITDTYFLNFALSYKKTFLERTYDKLDSSLANFMAVFNALEVCGKALTFFFASFSKEFFMFNYILRSRLIRKPIKKNQNFINVSNPPKIIDRNNMIINSTPSKSSPQFEVISDNESANDNNKTNKYMNINYHFKQKDLESKTRSENSDDILHDKIVLNTNENLKKGKDLKNENKEEKIDLNIFQNFWCNVLMSIDSEKSKYKNIENALEKIKLVQDLFDTSIYINTVLDIIRLKKLIFNEKQLILFENIQFSTDELKKYLLRIARSKEIYSNEELKKIIQSFENHKHNKLSDTLINIIKNQLNDFDNINKYI